MDGFGCRQLAARFNVTTHRARYYVSRRRRKCRRIVLPAAGRRAVPHGGGGDHCGDGLSRRRGIVGGLRGPCSRQLVPVVMEISEVCALELDAAADCDLSDRF